MAKEIVRCGRFGALEPWWHSYDRDDTDRATLWANSYDIDGKGLDALSDPDLAIAILRALDVPVSRLSRNDLARLTDVRYRVRQVFEAANSTKRAALINALLADATLGKPYLEQGGAGWNVSLVARGDSRK